LLPAKEYRAFASHICKEERENAHQRDQLGIKENENGVDT
jgi:hypothetical protein